MLAPTANAHSADMANADYFSHYAPSGASLRSDSRRGLQLPGRRREHRRGRSLAAPRAVVHAWLKSPGHCRVMMNGKYKEAQASVVSREPGKPGVYWTENFGTHK